MFSFFCFIDLWNIHLSIMSGSGSALLRVACCLLLGRSPRLRCCLGRRQSKAQSHIWSRVNALVSLQSCALETGWLCDFERVLSAGALQFRVAEFAFCAHRPRTHTITHAHLCLLWPIDASLRTNGIALLQSKSKSLNNYTKTTCLASSQPKGCFFVSFPFPFHFHHQSKIIINLFYKKAKETKTKTNTTIKQFKV